MKRLAMLMTVMCSVSVLAMPTRDELAKAQALVAELMAPAMADFKAADMKDKSAAALKVAEKSEEFANSAETAAAKFLFLKGAVSFYTRGEAYDKAADAVVSLQANVKDVPPDVIAEIVGKATSKISEAKAPQLYAIYRRAQLQIRAAGEVKSLPQKMKKVQSDALRRRYAEALAVSGDWKKAYVEFAKLGDAKFTKHIDAEAKGQANAAASGEFWWSYEPSMEGADEFFKTYAAGFYRKALANGEIDGLKKNLVENRLKQVDDAAATAVGAKHDAPVAESSKKIVPKVAKQGKTMKLKIKTGVEIEFVECPNGSFMMGKSGDNRANSCTRSHKVTITRPFWISKTQITRVQWEAFEKPCVADFYKQGAKVADLPVSFVSYEMANEYCYHLNRRFKEKLPPGYIIRLPSDAEWEYALTAGTDDFNSPYIMFRDGSSGEQDEVRSRIATTKDDIKREIAPLASDDLKKKYEAKGDASDWLRNRVGKKLPNNWGLYDMLGNGAEIVLDTVYQPVDWEKRIMPVDTRGRIRYQEEEIDPLRLDEHPGKFGSVCVVRGAAQEDKFSPDWYYRDGVPLSVGQNGQTFRLVIGPDLVSEWKAKHAKK